MADNNQRVHHRQPMPNGPPIHGNQPVPAVMGMTPEEYELAFKYVEADNYNREMEMLAADQRRQEWCRNFVLQQLQLAEAKRPLYSRIDTWALVVGIVGVGSALFAQWIWPYIQKKMRGNW
ncbi:hypothetical protein GGR51DRAFT_559275 [Nemania sp. FL0031]|nr:hypothetical protein GGR51DRAFT_559275 [Nemania sp. FL0031]